MAGFQRGRSIFTPVTDIGMLLLLSERFVSMRPEHFHSGNPILSVSSVINR